LTEHNYILQASKLTIGHGSNVLAANLNFSVKKGNLVGVFGENGKGKTTLIKTLAGFIPKLGGELIINNKNFEIYTPQQLAKLMSVVLTDRIFDGSLYVKDVLVIARTPYVGMGYQLKSDDIQAIDEAAKVCRIESFLQRKLISLSDGERQRVLLARAIAQQTEIILLDEPTAHLDIPNRELLFALLKQLTQQGKTILISTHEIGLAKQYIDQEILIG
jgi:iron complex transport system ATP-binding protein